MQKRNGVNSSIYNGDFNVESAKLQCEAYRIDGNIYCEESYKFPREERLKKNAEIRAVFKKGRIVSGRGAKLFYAQNGLCRNRTAFTFVRKFGNAVKRNKMRRLGRESYRLIRSKLEPGWDLIILFYPGEKAIFEQRFKQIKWLFEKAGLFIK